ncbi:MAG: hypothetical protein HN337_08355 [Deltaproteobacteria bacterium]|jgi:hypothetical protein|nr:hypothetical protein [Deltaproteobacteria bacterium]
MKKKMLIALMLFLMLPATAMAGSGYEGGFYVNNDDDSFRLTFNGRVQNQLYWQDRKDTTNTISFKLRRAMMGFHSKIAEKAFLGMWLMHAASSVENTTFQNVNVTGAVAGIEIIPAFVVTVGMVGLPLSFINEVSSAWITLPEFPNVVTRDDTLSAITPLRSSFGTPDGLGINLSGSYWKWFYSLSVINSAESNYAVQTNTKAMSYGFRTGWNILDPVPGKLTDFECSDKPKLSLSIGTDYQSGRTDPNGAVIKYLWTSSAGIALRWAGFSFTSEGFYRRTNITAIPATVLWARPKLTDIGYYANAAYYIIPKKFEIAAQASQTIRQGPANDSWEMGGGFNYYIFDNNLKLQLAYKMSRYFDWVAGTNAYSRQNAEHNITLMLSAIF